MTTSAELADRYGAPSPVRRRIAIALTVLLAVVFLAWLAWAAFFHGDPEAESGIVGYEVTGEHAVDVRMDVRLDGVDEAECLVRALSVDKSIVGELPFTATEGRHEVTVRTERKATSAEVVGCRAEGQSRYR
ncbi:DUF4307 domain-containing protein [Nocardioides gilvus]|uniref:DUF4307 domain-containing protein n=1 Tax=Nocardioides gilvus TaxID=1735589 RepID=UPI0013A593A8|nr:DUF4307 domain-containing protein [Nocardioides gilvus]